MFSDWLDAPANVVTWGVQLFVNWGPIPYVLAMFVILVVMRPHVPRGVPLHHRRAIVQMQWTFHAGLALAILTLMMAPTALAWLSSMNMISEVAAKSMSTMVVMAVGISFLLPFLFSVHVWFTRPNRWYADMSWTISPRIRLRVWTVAVIIWILTEVALVAGGAIFKSDTRGVSFTEILQTAFYYAVEGILFIGLSIYVQTRIARRAPIPGIPLALDMQRRRHDLGHVQQVSTVFLGAGVSRCLQYLAERQYETAPFWLAAASFVLCWVVSLATLILALIPTWVLMQRLDPAQKLMKDLEQRVLSPKRESDLFSLDHFRRILDWDEDKIITGSTPHVHRFLIMEILRENPTREELTAPGTGSAPEEVFTAYIYMARVATRVGIPLSAEELEGLQEIRQAMQELVERRATLNEGVASNLIPMPSVQNNTGLGRAFGLRRTSNTTVPLESSEPKEEVDENLRNLLGQTEATAAVGLDQQTLAAWEDFDEKKELIERQEEEMNEASAWQQNVMEAYGYNPYAYAQPGEYGGYDPYGDPYGYGPYGYNPGYDPSGYGAYAGYGDYLGYDPYNVYGEDPSYYGDPYYTDDPYASDYYGYPPYNPGFYPGYAGDPMGYPGYGPGMPGYADPSANPGYGYPPAAGQYAAMPTSSVPASPAGYLESRPAAPAETGANPPYSPPNPNYSPPGWNGANPSPESGPTPGWGAQPAQTPTNPNNYGLAGGNGGIQPGVHPSTPGEPPFSPASQLAPYETTPEDPDDIVDPRAVYPMGYVNPPTSKNTPTNGLAGRTGLGSNH